MWIVKIRPDNLTNFPLIRSDASPGMRQDRGGFFTGYGKSPAGCRKQQAEDWDLPEVYDILEHSGGMFLRIDKTGEGIL